MAVTGRPDIRSPGRKYSFGWGRPQRGVLWISGDTVLYDEVREIPKREARKRRARSVADELTREKTPVRFEQSIHIPEDEICFIVFDAPEPIRCARRAARAARTYPRRRGGPVPKAVATQVKERWARSCQG